MEGLRPEVWKILDGDEKMAVSLQLGYGKSSWESGEIMSKSHYKYLEILSRGERYIKMFTEQFELYDEVVPHWIKGEKEVKEYFRLTVQERWPVNSVHNKLDTDFGKSLKRVRNAMIVEQLRKWEKSEDAHQITLANFIKEFDRWNNFRVLPKEVQEPSAFKRRNKNLHKKHIKVATTLSDIAVQQLEKRFRGKKANGVYMPVVTKSGIEKVILLKNTKEIISYVSQYGLYVFKTQEEAKGFKELIMDYLETETKTCQQGLEFWPKYRDNIRRALNHDEVQRITPTRKGVILAYEKGIN